MHPYTIGGINLLPEEEKRAIYSRLIPRELIERFGLPRSYADEQGRSLLTGKWASGNPSAEMSLFHQADFPDPILYGHLTDTMNGQVHVLLYILNDPDSPRFEVDRMPDGRATKFGTLLRNLEAERAAMQAGLAPGQVRHGLRLLHPAMIAFENFVEDLVTTCILWSPCIITTPSFFSDMGFLISRDAN